MFLVFYKQRPADEQPALFFVLPPKSVVDASDGERALDRSEVDIASIHRLAVLTHAQRDVRNFNLVTQLLHRFVGTGDFDQQAFVLRIDTIPDYSDIDREAEQTFIYVRRAELERHMSVPNLSPEFGTLNAVLLELTLKLLGVDEGSGVNHFAHFESLFN